MAYPRFQRSRAFKVAIKNDANLSISSTTWVAADSSKNVALNAQVGDVLEAVLNCRVNNESVNLRFNVVTMVSGSPVNAFDVQGAYSSGSGGLGGWFCPTGVYVPIGSPGWWTVQSGDISNGIVTCQLMVRVDTATTRTVQATVPPLMFAVKNLGPVDPS